MKIKPTLEEADDKVQRKATSVIADLQKIIQKVEIQRSEEREREARQIFTTAIKKQLTELAKRVEDLDEQQFLRGRRSATEAGPDPGSARSSRGGG